MTDDFTTDAVIAAAPGTVFTYYIGFTPSFPPDNFGVALDMQERGYVMLFQKLLSRGSNSGIYSYEAHRISATTREKLDKWYEE